MSGSRSYFFVQKRIAINTEGQLLCPSKAKSAYGRLCQVLWPVSVICVC